MKTFLKFFSGTTGVIMAIALCSLCLLLAGVLACVVSGGAIIAVAGTPTP